MGDMSITLTLQICLSSPHLKLDSPVHNTPAMVEFPLLGGRWFQVWRCGTNCLQLWVTKAEVPEMDCRQAVNQIEIEHSQPVLFEEIELGRAHTLLDLILLQTLHVTNL